MKNKFNYVLKTLFLFVSFLFLGCEVQEEVVANSNAPKDFTIKTISIERLNAKLSKTKNKPDFSKIMTSHKDKLQQAKISNDAGVEIYTENIKEVTQGDYTSYTMLITIPQTNADTFYNITIEVKNNVSTFFITGYLPTENWKENPTTQSYEGQIATFRIPGSGGGGSGNILQEYVEDVIQDSDLLSGSYGFGNAGGGGGGNPSSYPWDCDGEVVTTYVIQPVMCSEDIHWPWSPGTCSASIKAYYETITTYECIPSPFDNDYGDDNPPTGGTTPGGGGGSTGSSPTSLTVVIKPDAPICQPAIPGDLNGDCSIDEDEANFIDFVAALSTDQEHFLDVNSSIKDDIFYFLVDNNWSVESKDYVEEWIDYVIINNLSEESIQEFSNILDLQTNGTINDEQVIILPDIPITDMADYLDCFNTSEGAIITIYADQPYNGGHGIWSLNDGVGHAFISIQQGNSIATLGFYPQSSVGSIIPNTASPNPKDFLSTPGIFHNNAGHVFDVSLSVPISSSGLTNVINGLISISNSNPMYNIGNSNCTDLAIIIFESNSSVAIPNCESPSPWQGQTPGTLGEIIRNMPTPVGGTKNVTGGEAPDNDCD